MNQKYKNSDKLLKRARKKAITIDNALSMVNDNKESDMSKSYWNTFYCSNTFQVGKKSKMKTTYCKNRWCTICESIKTAKMINGYLKPLQEIQDKQFTTLTVKTVSGQNLSSRLKQIADIWSAIRKKSVKQHETKGVVPPIINGIRKLEIHPTHNGKYHAHLHIIVDTKEGAEWIVNEWLNRWREIDKNLVSAEAQKIVPADENSVIELFKYTVKSVVDFAKSEDKLGREIKITGKKLDVIFSALKNKRTIQPFGNIQKDKDPIEKSIEDKIYKLAGFKNDELQSSENMKVYQEKLIELTDSKGLKRPKKSIGRVWTYSHFWNDWFSEYGEALTGYKNEKKQENRKTETYFSHS